MLVCSSVEQVFNEFADIAALLSSSSSSHSFLNQLRRNLAFSMPEQCKVMHPSKMRQPWLALVASKDYLFPH